MQKHLRLLLILLWAALPAAAREMPADPLPGPKQLRGAYADTVQLSEQGAMARYYFNAKQFATANTWCRKWIAYSYAHTIFRKSRADAFRLQSRIDSAMGNYSSAMANFQRYVNLRDSLFDEKTTGEISKLEAQYAASRKDQELALKKQSLQLAERKSELQASALAHTHLIRNMIIGIVVLCIFLLCLGFSHFLLKRRTTKAAEDKKTTIGDPQHALQLSSDVPNEKQSLMNEIHQRVEDSLQLVVRLMNDRPGNGEHSAAAAMHSGHLRMQAMSAIHQQLFQPGNGDQIDMTAYINELMDSLKTSFQDLRDIHFDVQVMSLQLPVSQAVPIGLIVNEVVTNAIKYAFVQRTGGHILVSLQPLETNMLALTITDNGQGLPEGFDRHADTSFGMQLIGTLVRQLKGKLDISSRQGVIVRVTFKQKDSAAQRNISLPRPI